MGTGLRIRRPVAPHAIGLLLLVAAGCAGVPASAQGYFGQISEWRLAETSDGIFREPHTLRVDQRSGVVYVLIGFRVQKYSPAGEFQLAWGAEGTGPGQFVSPAAMAVDRAGDVYVTDPGAGRVLKFSSTGDLLAQWGGSGSALIRPVGIAASSSGEIVISDTGTPEGSSQPTLQRYTASGTLLATAVKPPGFGRMAFGPKDVLFATGPYQARRMSISGEETPWGGPVGSDSKPDLIPRDVAVDPGRGVWLSFGSRIELFTDSGEFVTRCARLFAPMGTGPTGVSGISTGPTGDLFVLSGYTVKRLGEVSAPSPRCDDAPPLISSVAVRPRSFRARMSKRGAVLRYDLSEPATVTATVNRAGATRAASRMNVKAKRGTNRIGLTGWAGRRRLAPGRYRVTLRARDAAGNLSRPQSALFRILSASARRFRLVNRPAGAAAAAAPRCTTQGRTLDANASVRIYRIGSSVVHRVRVCFSRSGRSREVGQFDEDIGGSRHFVLAGMMVANEERSCESGGCASAIVVTSLRTRREFIYRAPDLAGEVRDIELRANGSVAWLRPIPGPSGKTLYQVARGTGGRQSTLDESADIDPTSLASAGGRLYWMRAGVAQTAAF